jgi:hypothetical protein
MDLLPILKFVDLIMIAQGLISVDLKFNNLNFDYSH